MVRDEFLGAAGASGGGGNPTTPSDLIAYVVPSLIYIYQWSSAGFGSQITGSPINYSGLGYLTGLVFSPDRTKLFFTCNSSPYIHGYNITNTAVGSKISDPSITPTQITGSQVFYPPTVSNNNDYIAFGASTYPYINVYALTSSGFGAKVANPTSPIFAAGISQGYSMAFAPDQSAIALGYFAGTTGIYTAAWRWSSAGFGAQYANVNWGNSGFNDACVGIQFTPDGQAIAGVRNSSASFGDSLRAWQWSSSTGFGSQYSNPNTWWTGSPWFQTTRSISISPNNDAIMCTSAGSANQSSAAPMHVFRWNISTGFGTVYSNQAQNVGFGAYNQSDCAKFSSNGGHIGLVTYNQPINFTPTNRLISTFTFSVAAGPVFLAYSPTSITNNSATYVVFN